MSLTKKDKEALAEWRDRHREELDKTLQVAISIRDSEKSCPKDRIEAGKLIARMLHALQPEREGAKKLTEKEKREKTELSDDERKFVESILSGN